MTDRGAGRGHDQREAGLSEERERKAEQSQFDDRMVALEPRVLLDAAMDATAEATADIAVDLEALAAEADAQREADENTLAAIAELEAAPNEVFFIDAAVENAEDIIASLPAGAEVVRISADSDGVKQIASHLEGRSDIDAIHIVSHGRSGTLDLGSTKLTESSMNGRHAEAMTVIASSLSEDADILIYGCDFAANARGASAVQALADVTGADVAASEDLTGAADLDGDWDLEVQKGTIEA
ncbi:MAG: DUF4347 domain-containing protein, partial [Pseudomonadota bacterium]